ncbi:protein tyrosine phosphatase family protein [Alteromonas sp. 009811495]|uniref:protein tyrosine phosphatase family protein n=1 Tax=Alteromonas sp. 009811495 TaxID=3002962 RepID=UPI00237E7F8E|nr:protein tyrosine phosphatase family protein [Alteromonas sp. 009811495]WDT85257.1 protein tyrosine phosphatase family protein [Alteromonas sp. 009811495]
MKLKKNKSVSALPAFAITLCFASALFHCHASALALSHSHNHDHAQTTENEDAQSLGSLTNLQHNNSFMLSSGLPSKTHLALLKQEGVSHVIDLIPGDRADEIHYTTSLDLDYFNVPVDWEAPSVANFLNYAAYMDRVKKSDGKVLTHCKLNWRGASFTYLYRVAVLGENEAQAKADLMKVWHPNPTWHAFMSDVVNYYNSVNNTRVAMSFDPAPIEG